MPIPRVLVLFRNRLFGQAVRAILEQADAIEVVGVQPYAQVNASSISSLSPSVIIVERARAELLEGPAAESALLTCAAELPGVREILLDLEDDRAWVCESWQLQDIGRDELLETIMSPGCSADIRIAGTGALREGGMPLQENAEGDASCGRASSGQE